MTNIKIGHTCMGQQTHHQRTGLCTPRALHVHTVHTVHSVHSVRTPAERLPSTKIVFLSVSLVNSLVLAAYIART